ncbi:hypothetical protein CMI47_03270 [Candidatus Pacearchaeota archaeon]|nr:hypothetical protein [Candidatus Pacearchaeota archaeon]|tara:strand:- start:814 stop:1548 length:735 start_codon:yes stop_codon:yes gene_type:complete
MFVDDKILESIKGYGKTCSVFNIKNNCITFAKSIDYFDKIKEFKGKVCVLIPDSLLDNLLFNIPKNIRVVKVDSKNLFYNFVLIHNELNKDTVPADDIIGSNCSIHKSVVIGVDGQNLAISSAGHRVFMKHIGNVIIEDGVTVDAQSVIHRSIFDSTIIKSGAIICAQVNIAHNCIVGENTFIAPGVKIAGGAKIGKNCWIWQGALIKNNISICDDVIIGMGSVVTKSIIEPGTYYGTPCVRIK